MNSNLNTLREKIQTLSAEQITEVEDFVEFFYAIGDKIKSWPALPLR